jgi:SSS family solute:Na+ symporter
VQQVPALAEYFSKANLAENGGRAAEAVPLMMGKLLPTGFLGLVMAGLMAAHMSVHDSYLLAWSTVISQDVIGPWRKNKPLTDAQSIWITRVSVVLIALFLLIWGVWYPLPESVWSYMSITGTIYLSGAATALIGGMYWKRASSTGALLSLLGGLFAILGLSVVREGLLTLLFPAAAADKARFLELKSSVEVWFNEQTVGLAVYVVCLVLFVVGSLLFPDPPKTAEQEAATR